MISEKISQSIKDALEKLGYKIESTFAVEMTDDFAHGDYASNVAMVLAKPLKKNPKTLAEEIVAELKKAKISEIEKIEIAGPGFINFFVSKTYLVDNISLTNELGLKYGNSEKGKGKKVVVEYSSPNIAKPFTIGHLRSTIIGDAVANILNATGHEVIRDNHLGDWGTQFGKQIVAIEKWGSLSELKTSKEPMKYLVALYVKFHEEAEKDKTIEDVARARFVDLENGETKAKEIYEATVACSLEYFNSIYEKLRVSNFDTVRGEAFYTPLIPAVIDELRAKKLITKNEGAELVFFEGEKYPPLMIVKTDGSTIYASRDLATDKHRLDSYGNEITIINEVGSEQSLYFKQLFETEKMLGWVRDGQRVHIAHGLYRFKDGKMSTRKGNVIWLEEILDEAVNRANEINNDSGEAVGIGAVKFNDLKRECIGDIIFSWDEILNLKGDSGPYLQYSVVRAKAVLRKAEGLGIKGVASAPVGESEERLARLLSRFPEIVARSGEQYAPHYIATYAIELAGAFNSFYVKEPIAVEGDTHSPAKVAMTKAVANTLEKALLLLGIQVPEKM